MYLPGTGRCHWPPWLRSHRPSSRCPQHKWSLRCWSTRNRACKPAGRKCILLCTVFRKGHTTACVREQRGRGEGNHTRVNAEKLDNRRQTYSETYRVTRSTLATAKPQTRRHALVHSHSEQPTTNHVAQAHGFGYNVPPPGALYNLTIHDPTGTKCIRGPPCDRTTVDMECQKKGAGRGGGRGREGREAVGRKSSDRSS